MAVSAAAEVPVGSRRAATPVGSRRAATPVGSRRAATPVGSRRAVTPVAGLGVELLGFRRSCQRARRCLSGGDNCGDGIEVSRPNEALMLDCAIAMRLCHL